MKPSHVLYLLALQLVDLDIRVASDLGEAGVLQLLEKWTAGEGLDYLFTQRAKLLPETSTSKNDQWWSKIEKSLSGK
jgi:hypothetical protein